MVIERENILRSKFKDAVESEVKNLLIKEYKEMERMQDNIDKLEQALVELHSAHIAQDHARAQTILSTKTVTHQQSKTPVVSLNQTEMNPKVIDLLQKSLNRSESDRNNEAMRADSL